MLERWGRFHVVRTSFGMLALVSYLAAGLAGASRETE
jgi:hypothetical protein